MNGNRCSRRQSRLSRLSTEGCQYPRLPHQQLNRRLSQTSLSRAPMAKPAACRRPSSRQRPTRAPRSSWSSTRVGSSHTISQGATGNCTEATVESEQARRRLSRGEVALCHLTAIAHQHGGSAGRTCQAPAFQVSIRCLFGHCSCAARDFPLWRPCRTRCSLPSNFAPKFATECGRRHARAARKVMVEPHVPDTLARLPRRQIPTMPHFGMPDPGAFGRTSPARAFAT